MSRAARTDPRRYWTERLRRFVPQFLASHESLAPLRGSATVLLYGSTTMGVDDPFSDLDMWLLLPVAALAELDRASRTRFFEIKLDGKAGHLSAEATPEFAQRLERCDMDLIYQLRKASVIQDGQHAAPGLIRAARRPMRPQVSRALFFFHYVEMRSEHRACDNPIARGDPAALLLSLPKVVAHALRAAMVLDAQPYPYDKWLCRAAAETPTGRSLAPHVDALLDSLAADALRQTGSVADHPVTTELMAVRQKLVQAARAKGWDEPWLAAWWLFMDQARGAVEGLRW